MPHVPPTHLDEGSLAKNLEHLLRERRVPAKLPGAQLAPLINEALGQGYSFKAFFPQDETPKLRSFVERFIPEHLVRVTGERTGTDYLFAIPLEASAIQLTHDGRLWKTFAAAHPSRQVVYNRKTATVAVLAIPLPVPDDCVVVPPISSEEHQSFCLDFCNLLREEGALGIEGLQSTLSEPDDDFYQSWLSQLKKRGLLKRWGEYRHERILDVYVERLTNLNVSAERAKQLRQELALDHDTARKPKGVDELIAARVLSAPGSNQESRERRARELLKAAAETMTYEQLMAISIPLSVVLRLTDSLNPDK